MMLHIYDVNKQMKNNDFKINEKKVLNSYEFSLKIQKGINMKKVFLVSRN